MAVPKTIFPIYRTQNLKTALAAPLADPLWLLTRQWQVGELCGEDAATAGWVEWSGEARTPTTLTTTSGSRPLPAGPTEAAVEAEAVWQSPGWRKLSLEIGSLLIARLGNSPLAAKLCAPREELGSLLQLSFEGLAAEPGLARLKLLARRSFDGYKLFLAQSTNSIKDAGSSAIRNALKVALPDRAGKPAPEWADLEAWVAQVRELLVATEGGAWVPERQEYSFQLGLRQESAKEDALVLNAREYRGSYLDAETFDLIEEKRGGAAVAPQNLSSGATMPGTVRYPGMPASRWWEFEDGRVHFGGVEAEPLDVIRLVIAEFAISFGDDWLLLPVRLRRGALNRLKQVCVVDNFCLRSGGKLESRELVPMAARDAGINAARSWRFLELSGDKSADRGSCPWLFVPETVGDRQEGESIEDVLFVRDEQANLGWAVERRLEGIDGVGRSRPAAPRPDSRMEGWSYTVADGPPPGWVPLVPVPKAAGSSEILLQRGRLAGWKAEDFPKALVLNASPPKPLTMDEEVLPVGGMIVRRHWQRARGSDGKVYLWIGREKRPGRGEQSAGLAVDRLRVG